MADDPIRTAITDRLDEIQARLKEYDALRKERDRLIATLEAFDGKAAGRAASRKRSSTTTSGRKSSMPADEILAWFEGHPGATADEAKAALNIDGRALGALKRLGRLKESHDGYVVA